MLPEETFPLQNVAARSSFWAVGATGPRRCAPELAQGAWLRPERRRLSRAQSCFPTKENPWGVGFGGRRPPAKQQDPGSQGQPRPALPSGEQRAGGEIGLLCFPEPRCVGAVVGCPRRLSLCRMQPLEARFGSSVRPGLALSGRAGSGCMAAAWAQKAFARPIMLPRQGEPVGSGFQAPDTPSKAGGSREPGAAPPRCALWRAEGQGRKRLALLS